MNKHDAFKELGAVLRQSPVPLSKLESGPAPMSARLQFLNSNQAGTSSSSQGSNLLSSLLSGITGGSGSPSSLLAQFLGSAGSGGTASALGLGVAPLVSGLVSLFGGGASKPQPLNLYSAPQHVNLQAGLHNGSVGAADHSQTGTARSSKPQITLQVQAMDSKSILDRSTDIAQAVRQAMLQSHPINDVVADL